MSSKTTPVSRRVGNSNNNCVAQPDSLSISEANKLYEVKVYNAQGKLKQVISRKELRKRARENLEEARAWRTKRET